MISHNCRHWSRHIYTETDLNFWITCSVHISTTTGHRGLIGAVGCTVANPTAVAATIGFLPEPSKGPIVDNALGRIQAHQTVVADAEIDQAGAIEIAFFNAHQEIDHIDGEADSEIGEHTNDALCGLCRFKTLDQRDVWVRICHPAASQYSHSQTLKQIAKKSRNMEMIILWFPLESMQNFLAQNARHEWGAHVWLLNLRCHIVLCQIIYMNALWHDYAVEA